MRLTVTILLVWLAAIPVWAATRVALVSTCGGDSAGDVLALAEAKLSQEPDIVLVERREVERVLEEQHLTRCGLSDAGQALAVGKLLGVEVFAVFESFPNEQEVSGLVVFDAASGARLADVVLPSGVTETVAQSIVATVRGALVKRNQVATAQRTVCVSAVRNADLPREFDTFCDAVGVLLERELVASPELAVLERKRLEFATTERSLPAAAALGPLRGALSIVEVEINRAIPDGGVRASAYMTRPDQSPVPTLTVTSATHDAAALARALSREIARTLKVTPPGLDADRAREAERFHQETKFRWSYGEWLPALQAAESAYALDPKRIALDAALAKALLGYATELIHPGGQRASGSYRSTATDDMIQRSQQIARRGGELLRQARAAPPLADKTEREDTGWSIWDGSLYLSRYTAQVLQLYQAGTMAANWDPEIALKIYADEGDLTELKRGVQACTATWCDAATKATVLAVAELTRQSARRPMRDRADAKPHSPELTELRRKLVQLEQDSLKLSSKEILHRAHEFRVQVQEIVTATQPNLELREAYYLAGQDALGLLRKRHEFTDEATELCAFELTQGDISAGFCHEWLGRTGQGTLAQQRRWLAVLDHTITLLKSPECHLTVFYKKNLLGHCEQERRLRLRRHPELGFQPATPWQSVRVLVDLKPSANSSAELFSPLVQEDAVYFLQIERPGYGETLRLQLTRVALPEGRVEPVGQPTTVTPESGSVRMLKPGRSCLANGCYYIPLPGVGIFAFPLDGSEAHRLSEIEGFTCARVESLAWLEGRMYAALWHRGCLIGYDPASRSCDVIASSRRKQKLSPFDDGPPLHIPYMVADPPRQRLVFFDAAYSGSTGLWAYEPKTRAFKQLAEICVDPAGTYWGSDPAEDRFILGTNRGAFQFDLRSDHTEFVLKMQFAFPENRAAHYAADPNPLLDFQVRIWSPLMIHDGWLWHAYPWGRMSLDGRRREDLAALRPETPDNLFQPDQCLAPVGDGSQILVADRRGLWLLTLPKDSSKDSP